MVYRAVLEQANYVLIFMASFSASRVNATMMDVPLFYFLSFFKIHST